MSSTFEHVSGGIFLKKETNPDLRTIAYETCKKEKVVIVKQELRDKEWITINHMALPIVIFDYIQSFRFEKALTKGAQYTIDHVTGYIRKFVFNPETIDGNVRKILYDYDIKEIPLYENQEGYWKDLQIIDSFWRITTSPESPITTRSNSSLPNLIKDIVSFVSEIFYCENYFVSIVCSVLYSLTFLSIVILRRRHTTFFLKTNSNIWPHLSLTLKQNLLRYVQESNKA